MEYTDYCDENGDEDNSEYQKLENKLNEITGTSMRPKRGNSGRIIRRNFARQERLDALAEFYTNNKKKYPEASAEFFSQHPELQKKGC